mgnify:CR=1 FL=1
MQLRQYQQQAVDAVYNYLRRYDDNPCVVIPTAGGKTPILATIVKDAIQQWDSRVMILSHVKELLEQAVADGADVVFATTPQLRRSVLRVAVKYPKVRFLNCSVDAPYSSVRTYYSRIYEGKFITGAIAGAMSKDDRIGYNDDGKGH